jgi:drug/metabolite transporter (DMT)-like permease
VNNISKEKLYGIILAMSAVIIWSMMPIILRALLRDNGGSFSSFDIAFLRVLIAAITLYLLPDKKFHECNEECPKIKSEIYQWIAGAAIAANYLLYNIGIKQTSATMAALLTQISPIVLILISARLLNEKVSSFMKYGAIIAFSGVAFTIYPDIRIDETHLLSSLVGDFYLILSAVVWVVYAVAQKKLLNLTGRDCLAGIFIRASVISLPFVFFKIPYSLMHASLIEYVAMFAIGSIGTAVSYRLYTAGLRKLKAAEGTIFNIFIPIFTGVGAAITLNESLSHNLIIGFIMVASGIILSFKHQVINKTVT